MRHHSTLLGFALMLVLAVTSNHGANAQNDAQLTQYWNVLNYYNPAATGNIDSIHVNVGSRLQWVGIEHAPMAFIATGDMPFKFLNRRWGVGVVAQQQSEGLFRGLQVGVQLAWKKKMLGGELSVALQAGLINETFKGSETIIPEGDEAHDSNDDAIPQADVAGNGLDLGAGAMFRHKWFWAGVSAMHANAPTLTLKQEGDEEKVYEFDVKRAYYFVAGSNIPLKNTLFELQPSVMLKSDLKTYQAEATARVRYNKFLSGGVGYRHGDAVSLLLGANYKGFFISYSYDYAISEIRKASSGSHELFVGYNVKLNMGEKNKNKHKSIRIM